METYALLGRAASTHRQVAATKMLRDFQSMGVDEELEQLRGNWSQSFGSRPGFPAGPTPGVQRRRPRISAAYSFPLELELEALSESSDDGPPRETLAQQGKLAMQRLETLGSLRKAAAGVGSPADWTWRSSTLARGQLCLGDASCGSFAASPAAGAVFQLHGPGGSQRQSPAGVAVADPWEEWERRWAHEFQQFEEVGCAWRAKQRAEEELREAAARLAEAEAATDWRRKLDAVKRQAAESTRKREQQQRQPGAGSHPSPGAGAHKSSSSSKQGSSSSSSQGIPRPPLPQPPAPAAPARGKNVPMDIHFASFTDFDAAWTSLEPKISGAKPLRCSDIPWPTSLKTVSGIEDSDSAADKKRKLRAALVRWHPDKWGRIMDAVQKDEQSLVMERVKEVTQRVLDEKKHHA